MAKLGGSSATSSSASGNSKTTSAKPANLKPGTYWDIQLGAFSSKDNAKDFARKLSRAGFKDIVLQTSASKGITRVAIKEIPAEKVLSTQDKLSKAGFTEQTLKKRK